MIRTIDETISVAPQIAPEALAALAEAGFTTIINNRPEDEEPGQPGGAAIRAAAEAAGLGYVALPVTPGQFTRELAEAMAAAVESAPGPVLAFCRSGTRSCTLWALGQAIRGADADALIAKAAGAGYDLAPMRPALQALAAAD